MELIEEGRQYLKEQGLDQWQGPYPELEDIQTDITKERGYFVTDGTAFVAYLCIDFQGEPDYEQCFHLCRYPPVSYICCQQGKRLIWNRISTGRKFMPGKRSSLYPY